MIPAEHRELLDQLYFDGPDRLPFLRRFASLLALSVLIAVFGLAEDSGPVVIGAMLISPLTTPLLGLSAGLVMGWPRRQLESLAILVVASLGGLGLAWLAMKLIPEPSWLTLQSGELLARTEPRLLDLAVAIVAGAAGAYVLIRREAIGALPGVAIAVALVPPLSAVGMTLELGRSDLAGEALLLYLTNLAGIVLAASATMVALGVRHRPAGEATQRGRTALGLGLASLAVLAVAVPLGVVSADRVQEAVDHNDVTAAADDWLAGTSLELERTEVEDENVRLEVAGPRRPPPLAPLIERIREELGEEVDVRVAWTAQRVFGHAQER